MTISYKFSCPNCQSALPADQPELCLNCGARFNIIPSEPKFDLTHTPDKPSWGVGSAIGMWFLSVLLILGAPIAAGIVWIVYKMAQGVKPDMADLTTNPNFIVLFLLATFIAQLLTLAAAHQLVVVTSKQPFFKALGWFWHPRFKLWHTILFTIFILALTVGITQLLPNKESDLERLLKSSLAARLLISALAVISAPIVEEVIYRGILYAALRKSIGLWPAIIAVSLLFAGVHVFQYWGAWGVITSLMALSFGLTVIRAFTGSLLPCFVVHLLFNGLQAIGIVAQGFLEKP